MPNFEPEGAFQGYVVAKLEAMSDRLSALPCKENEGRLRKVETDVSNIKGKAAVFGTLGGVITYLFGKLLGK